VYKPTRCAKNITL